MNFPRILKKRKGYIDRIKPFMQKSVVKVLTGQRRVGKSFLLYQLIEEILAKNRMRILSMSILKILHSVPYKQQKIYTRTSFLIAKKKLRIISLSMKYKIFPGLKKSSVRSCSMKIMIYTLQVVTPRCFQENSPLI